MSVIFQQKVVVVAVTAPTKSRGGVAYQAFLHQTVPRSQEGAPVLPSPLAEETLTEVTLRHAVTEDLASEHDCQLVFCLVQPRPTLDQAVQEHVPVAHRPCSSPRSRADLST